MGSMTERLDRSAVRRTRQRFRWPAAKSATKEPEPPGGSLLHPQRFPWCRAFARAAERRRRGGASRGGSSAKEIRKAPVFRGLSSLVCVSGPTAEGGAERRLPDRGRGP